MINRLLILMGIVTTMFTPTVIAHGNELSFEKQVDDFLIDIGYGESQITAGAPTRLDFNIVDTKKNETVEFDNVFVRINEGEKTIFAGSILKSIFSRGITYTFPHGGDYELYIRFQKDTDAITEAAFPIKVLNNDADPDSTPISYFLISGVLGLIIGFGSSKFFKK
ncbi:MAG TPA: hypothetical protein VI432_02290 [Candidatus Paceibacterota bacterium]